MQNGFLIGEFHQVEPSLNSVTGPAATTRLEPKVMQVLVCLAAHAGQVVSKEDLMRTVWPDTFVGDDVLTRAISELRRVLGDAVRDPRFIQTIPKSGYRLIAPVSFGKSQDGDATRPPAPVDTVQSHDDGLVATGVEAPRPRASPRTPLGSLKRGLATLLVLAAVLLVGFIGQQMTAAQSARVVRSVQLTFTGQVAMPGFESDLYPALVTDGSRVYFSQFVRNHYTLAQSSVGGGEVVTIRTPFTHTLLFNVSPDGSRLLVRDYDSTQPEGPLWVIPALGGPPLRVGAAVGHDGAWSPDGKRIVFAYREDLYVARSDGSEPRKLVTTPGRAFWVRWSPDGTRLRFTLISAHGYAGSLWEVSAEGHDLRPVPLARGDHDLDCCGDWSPDSRHFFFRRIRDKRSDIWAVRERKGLFGRTATEPARLTSGPPHFVAVVPTRDSQRLLVIGTQPRGENLRFDQGKREFAPYHAGGAAGWFAFSRDGQSVAYIEFREGVLWRSRVDGSERRQLTQPPLRLLLPRWSPDGTRLAFMGRMPGQPWKTYVIPAEGGEPQVILADDRAEADPDWAPDGESLMFGRPPDYLAEASVPKAIHLLDLKSRKLSTLPDSDGLFAPRWSPSGRYVAALTLNQSTLLLFDFIARKWTELGRFKTVHNPVWSRDERFLYFEVVDEATIYRIRVSDRAAERVVALEGVWKTGFESCRFEGLELDDSPLIGCFRDDRDVYALDWEMR